LVSSVAETGKTERLEGILKAAWTSIIGSSSDGMWGWVGLSNCKPVSNNGVRFEVRECKPLLSKQSAERGAEVEEDSNQLSGESVFRVGVIQIDIGAIVVTIPGIPTGAG